MPGKRLEDYAAHFGILKRQHNGGSLRIDGNAYEIIQKTMTSIVEKQNHQRQESNHDETRSLGQSTVGAPGSASRRSSVSQTTIAVEHPVRLDYLDINPFTQLYRLARGNVKTSIHLGEKKDEGKKNGKRYEIYVNNRW